MNIKTEFKFGKPTEFEWSGVYGYTPPQTDILEKRGQMFVVTRIKSSSEEVSVDKIAKMMVEELQLTYFDPQNPKTGLEAIENASYKMKYRIETINSKEPALMDIGLDIEMAVVVIQKDILYALVVGESKIQILREQTFLDISKALIDRESVGLFKSGSLEIQKDDKLILYTNNFIDSSDPNIAKVVEELDLNLIEVGDKPCSAILIADENSNWKQIKQTERLPAHELESNTEKDLDELEEGKNIDLQGNSEINEELENKDTRVDNLSNQVLNKFGQTYTNIKISIQNLYLTKLKNKINFNNSKSDREYSNENEDETSLLQSEKSEEEIAVQNLEVPVLEDQIKTSKGFTGLVMHIIKIANSVKNYFKYNQKTYIKLIALVWEKLNILWQKFMAFFILNILGRNKTRKYVDKSKIKRNRYVFAVVIVSIFLFLLNSINQTIKVNNQKKAIALDQEKIATYTSTLNQLDTSISTTVLSQASLREGKIQELEKLKKDLQLYKQDSLDQTKIDTLIKSIENLKNKAMLKVVVEKLDLVTDFGLLGSKVNLSDMEITDNAIFLSDEEKGVIYKINMNIGSIPTEHIVGLEKPFLLQKAENEIIFYDNSNVSSIGRFDPNVVASANKYPALPRSEIGSAKETAYFSGNQALYELNIGQSQIFKREKVGEEYAGGGTLINSNNPPSWKIDAVLSDAIDIEVPYEIYVLIKNKGIQRYLAGGENTLLADNLANQNKYFLNTTTADLNSIKTATSFNVSDKYVVVGDSLNKRVLLFEIVTENEDKPLKFLKQFTNESTDKVFFNDIREVKINQTTNQIFVLDGTRVIVLDI